MSTLPADGKSLSKLKLLDSSLRPADGETARTRNEQAVDARMVHTDSSTDSGG